jgi:hypothetical protein|tara:strand:- start:463 stop:1386 length:924 start_codon:yes stop_codon:yes gene_type:complete
MTLAQAITMTLNRVGLNPTTTAYKDQARLYLNIVAKRICGEVGGKWWWLHKSTTFLTTKTMTVSGIAGGSFVAGETVTGNSSGATAVVDANYDSTNYPTALTLHTFSGTFVTADNALSNGTGVSAAYVSLAVTQTYALAADVLVPHSFVDVTNDRTIVASGWDNIDAEDPDRDYETDARIWSPEGVDALSGKIRVRLFPYHDTPGDTIRYRYRGFIVDWTSGDDSTELDRYLPEIFQPALPFGAAEMYLQEKGDSEAAGENRFEYNGVIDRGKETNRTIWGNRTWRRNRGDDNNQFVLADGSLTAAS